MTGRSRISQIINTDTSYRDSYRCIGTGRGPYRYVSVEPGAITTAASKSKRKVRIIGGNPARYKHQLEQPWPAAVVRQCARCHAWMVPPL